MEELLITLNKLLGKEFAVPANWSPQILHSDLMKEPVKSQEILIQELQKVNDKKEPSYLEFYFATRGVPKLCTDRQKKLYEIFGKGQIMLYFESVFIDLLNSPPKENEGAFLQFISALSSQPLNKWDSIVAHTGACCYQWFVKEPYAYIKLLTRKDKKDYNNYTDEELFQIKNWTLQMCAEKDKVSIHDSRSYCIQLLNKNN